MRRKRDYVIPVVLLIALFSFIYGYLFQGIKINSEIYKQVKQKINTDNFRLLIEEIQNRCKRR